MSRLSIRPRPLDIHKRLPIVKSSNEFEDDEAPATNSTRNLYHYRLQVENDNEVHQTPATRKSSPEIPTPKCSIVDTYEEDYGRTFMQSASYIRRRGARAEIGEFVDYDLDNEDEDWLEEFNNERKALTPEKFEALLFKLEVMDHKARERAGLVNPTFGSPVPVILQLDSAAEALQYLSVRLAVFQSVYNYWRAKREQWQKPILRRLQPPPPPSDTNPYNVFRPREKAHRLHTRRMQRRENNVQSFEKLRQVRRSLDQAKKVLEALIKREEKKREVIECEVNLQQLQMEYMMAGDGMEFPSLQEASCQFASSNEDYIDSDDTANGYPQTGHSSPHMQYAESKLVRIPTFRIKRKLKSSPLYSGWIQKDSDDPVLLFMKPLDVDKLAAVGIVHPPDPPAENGSAEPPYRFHGRIGRGGRIIFDRCNPLLRGPERTHFVAPNSRPSPPNG